MLGQVACRQQRKPRMEFEELKDQLVPILLHLPSLDSHSLHIEEVYNPPVSKLEYTTKQQVLVC